MFSIYIKSINYDYSVSKILFSIIEDGILFRFITLKTKDLSNVNYCFLKCIMPNVIKCICRLLYFVSIYVRLRQEKKIFTYKKLWFL